MLFIVQVSSASEVNGAIQIYLLLLLLLLLLLFNSKKVMPECQRDAE